MSKDEKNKNLKHEFEVEFNYPDNFNIVCKIKCGCLQDAVKIYNKPPKFIEIRGKNLKHRFF